MNVLITGAFGILGSRLANYILIKFKKREVYVYGVDDGLNANKYNLRARVTQSVQRVEDFAFETLFANKKFDIVYHFASCKAPNRGIGVLEEASFMYKNNVCATAKVASLCEKYGAKLVFASTLDRRPSLFVNSKLMSEIDLKSRKNLDWCIVRFGYIFGAHQKIDYNNYNILSKWAGEKYYSTRLSIPGDGLSKVVVNCVDDLIEPLFWITERDVWKKEINFIGDVVTLNKLCRTFIAAYRYYKNWDSDDPIEDLDAKYVEGEDMNFILTEKNSSILDYKKRQNLKHSMHDFWSDMLLQIEQKRF